MRSFHDERKTQDSRSSPSSRFAALATKECVLLQVAVPGMGTLRILPQFERHRLTLPQVVERRAVTGGLMEEVLSPFSRSCCCRVIEVLPGCSRTCFARAHARASS